MSRRGGRSPAPVAVTEQRKAAQLAAVEREKAWRDEAYAEQPQAVTQTIVQPPPEVTEVITQPPAQAPAPELAAIATEEELRLFGGRPLSSSVTVRDAWLRANPGPEQIFDGLVADLAAWRQATTDPGPAPEATGSEEVADGSGLSDTESPGPEAQPPAGALAAPVASGPVTAVNGTAGSGKGSARPPAKKRTKAAGA